MNFEKILQGGRCIGCGTAIEHFGVCDACADQFDRDRTAEIRHAAIATIPGDLRWATFDAPELPARVDDHRAIEIARKAADSIAAGRLRRVVIVGQSGSGKSSLACAMLRRVIESSCGRTARFAGAIALAMARMDSSLGGRPYAIDAAIRSSCLLLDDLGQEPPRGEHSIREVIHERFDMPVSQPQIVTTWIGVDPSAPNAEWDQAKLQARYGDGTARRIVEHALVINLMGATQ